MILTGRAPAQLLTACACTVAGAAKSALRATKSLGFILASLFCEKKPWGSG
jgi:hypothetical protein